MAEIEEKLSCQVCGDLNASKHYGSYCCSGCKGFFRRTLRNNRHYICLNEDDCPIIVENRNCCRACRYKKCLQAGLNPYLVHGDFGSTILPDSILSPDDSKRRKYKKRGERLSITSESSEVSMTSDCSMVKKENELSFEEECSRWQKLALNFHLDDKEMENAPLGYKRILPKMKVVDADSIAVYFVLVEKLCDNFIDSNANHMTSPTDEYFCSTAVSAEKALFQPRSVSSRTAINWSADYFIDSSGMKRMYCRILTHYGDWVSHIPEIFSLSYSDRVRLVIDRNVPCIDILLAYRSVINNAEGLVLSGGSYYPRKESDQRTVDIQIRPYLKRLTDTLYDEFIIPAKKMKMTEAEYALLRLLVFFLPVEGLSDDGKRIVRQAANFYRNVLSLNIQKEFPDYSTNEIMERMSKLMSFLPVIEIAKSAENAGFSIMTLFNIADLNGELTYEIYVKSQS
uniref:Uncharacterized protein n=1 Tax=Panagrolaimus sp. JU765 TaxID=591449 RepID=A0AC34PW72_9BILA